VQCLPFGALSWENFERLCHRLIEQEADVEYCARFGQQGEAQEGIDIFARQSDGRYHCLQAKRYQAYSPVKLREAVDVFLAGSWATRAARFTIAVQALLRSTAMQEEVERQAVRLGASGIRFVALDGETLTDQLRSHPVLIDDFFGRPWVSALLGSYSASNLGARLDGAAFARVREQLTRVYEANFQFVDPGSFGSISEEDSRPALTLLERFQRPDILVREAAKRSERADSPPKLLRDRDETTVRPGTQPGSLGTGALVKTGQMRRIPLDEWLGDGERIVVLGEAGSGKSTLLRVIALDLLRGYTRLPELAARWGRHIPVYIPFARWSSQVARDGSQVGIKEIVRRSLEQFLTASIVDLIDCAIDGGRVLLLIDGLDEWSNEQAARSTLSALVTTAEAHGIPVVAAGRPRGLSRIGTLPALWKRGTVAPLSTAQQATIADRWFQRYAVIEPAGKTLSHGSLRGSRFMAELARDASLGALAAVPLLLIGLVTLALRGQILPRTRGDVYDQLVRILLEIHPDSRATASGDTEPRFRHATDPDQRRAALARLAFAAREGAGDAGIPSAGARDILRAYLASPRGFDLTTADASVAAGEILSVNAETQGLIVEKAPNEVGFVHASFEEFLAAEHVSSWPFSEIEAFVRTRSGDGRWRNVITNLLSKIQRRDELDRLVAIIEEPEQDQLLRFHKEALLGDVAFGAAGRSPTTARRLALSTMRRVETEDWLPARREALASVLRGLADPALKADIQLRLERWLPARIERRAALIGEFGSWNPTTALQETLWQAMHDEDSGVQRAAAAAYAKVFGPSAEGCQHLLSWIRRARDLAAAAAMLESLALGWPTVPEAMQLFDEAFQSHSGALRLCGILGLAEAGTVPEEAREVVLRGQNFSSNLSYPYRELAVAMLMKYWPGDDTLVQSALQRASGDIHSPWEYDAAIAYLMESPTDRADVRAWILGQFATKFPFHASAGKRSWANLGRFAKVDSEIRASANAFWLEPANRLINMYMLPSYTAQIADEPVADALLGVLLEKENQLHRHWAVIALLVGWGRNDPKIRFAMDVLAHTNDDNLVDLVALLAEILPDKTAARERLVRMGPRADVRRDLLAAGLEACGCDHTDDEAVEAIFAQPVNMNHIFGPSLALFRAFGAHPQVRALALTSLHEADGPLPAIAAAYGGTPDFAEVLLAAATPLPIDLRTQIIEIAANGAAGTVLEAVLSRCMLETDPELRVRMVIAHYRSLPPSARDAAKPALLAKAAAVGPDFEAVRAAALAGLIMVGGLDVLAQLGERGQPAELGTISLRGDIPTIDRLICERFGDFEATFGDTLPKRLKSFAQEGRLAEILSVAPGASPEARAAFLALAEGGKLPRTLGPLRALAAEWPRSDLLLAHCWKTLSSLNDRNDRAFINAEIGLILREQFPADSAVRKRLIDEFASRPSAATAMTLAIFAPDADVLPRITDFDVLGREFSDWAIAAHVAAHRTDAVAFCAFLEAMVTRPWRSQFDAQSITNLAVEERLQLDPDLEVLLTARIAENVHPSVSGSFARYLAATGKLGLEARRRALHLLQVIDRNERLPTAGYDALADQWRATRATLLDAVSAGLELT
jgi:energy-coupling factor transporter ATP-binding protein EcfA2